METIEKSQMEAFLEVPQIKDAAEKARDSTLNAEAKEFTPKHRANTPGKSLLLKNDPVVAQSPRKDGTSNFDTISIPSEDDFTVAIQKCPHSEVNSEGDSILSGSEESHSERELKCEESIVKRTENPTRMSRKIEFDDEDVGAAGDSQDNSNETSNKDTSGSLSIEDNISDLLNSVQILPEEEEEKTDEEANETVQKKFKKLPEETD